MRIVSAKWYDVVVKFFGCHKKMPESIIAMGELNRSAIWYTRDYFRNV